jgi:hypothetical protein
MINSFGSKSESVTPSKIRGVKGISYGRSTEISESIHSKISEITNSKPLKKGGKSREIMIPIAKKHYSQNQTQESVKQKKSK